MKHFVIKRDNGTFVNKIFTDRKVAKSWAEKYEEDCEVYMIDDFSFNMEIIELMDRSNLLTRVF